MGNFQHLLDLIADNMEVGVQLGLALLEAEDRPLDGRSVYLDGQPRIQFSSCSYLGLELHPALKEGAIRAVERFGTQFSSSRTFISAPMYGALEEMLGELTGGHVMVAPNTTLGTISTLPVIIHEEDAVLLDHQVHHTVQLVMPQLQALGIPVTIVRHGNIEKLEERICELRSRHRRIWYLTDGIYSMFGSLAPMKALSILLDRYEQLNLYIDDAHGMSWTGLHGRGYVLDTLGSRDRVVVAVSLNKSFGAGGGAIVFPDAASCQRVRRCGGPMIFTGPLQPPVLGAAMASAKLHLSDELPELQAQLRERIRFTNRRARELDLPLANRADVPIRFLGLGPRDTTTTLVRSLLDRGFLVNPATFPAVAAHRTGARFTITRHQSLEDIEALLTNMAEILPEALATGSTNRAEIARAFGLGAPAVTDEIPTARESGLHVETADSIETIPRSEWDAMFADRGSFDWVGCRTMEALFCKDRKPENRCTFHYVVVRDEAGLPVLGTILTESLMKDDMFAEPAVSKVIEARRADDPHFLTSRVLAMGCPLTEGNHLYLNRNGDWRSALQLLSRLIEDLSESLEIDLVILRDLPVEDGELEQELATLGFHAIALPTSLVAQVPADREALLASLSRRARRFQADDVTPLLDRWTARVLRPDEIAGNRELSAHLYQLYLNVQQKSFHLNTFALPEDLLDVLAGHEGWEIVTLTLAEEPDSMPSAFFAAHIGSEAYAPLIVGLDYRHVTEDGVYRQCIHHTLERANAHGASRVLMGMGAELEKKRFGAQGEERVLFARAKDHFTADVLTLLSADTHTARRRDEM
ncbi:MAG: aminotransferase class I/II-fold pyridoxal phosphate-dependent enzyme [bacterium]|nr:aminotransferase class I/II-fold pyridoxal phosphate-dependent enzyme [bacterium]MCP5070797.1 aminotransferase class I/II-fold pyridoxal phosphate-dependent enzyme [bacterium]